MKRQRHRDLRILFGMVCFSLLSIFIPALRSGWIHLAATWFFVGCGMGASKQQRFLWQLEKNFVESMALVTSIYTSIKILVGRRSLLGSGLTDVAILIKMVLSLSALEL